MSALIDELKNAGGVDIAGALERMGDSEELYETILGMFLTDENYEELKERSVRRYAQLAKKQDCDLAALIGLITGKD